MKVILKMIKLQEKDFIFGKINIHILENFYAGKCMVKGYINGLMEINIKEIIFME